MNESDPEPNANRDTGVLNTLLRGELAAVETYDQALRKLEDQHVLADLVTVREEHARAADVLRGKVTSQGGEPVGCTGPWGAAAAAMTGTTHVIGPATALLALLQGEEHGISEYEGALGNDDVDADCQNTIRAELLPCRRRHIDELNRLMGGMT